MKIPVSSPTIRRKEMDAVLTCMVTEKIGPGEINARLLQTVKEQFGIDGCAALRSPAIALDYALKALDLPKESGIIISALSPKWHYTAVTALGYKPIVVDVSTETSLVTQDSIQDGITRGGRLILLHETLGFLPDFDQIASFGIPIIEDISQSAGGFFDTSDARFGGSAPQDASADGGASVTSETGGVGDTDAHSSKDASFVTSGGGYSSYNAALFAKGKKAGTFGVYSILGLEAEDILTAGGGAVLIAPTRREWIVLKKFIDEAPSTDILPDINSALGFVQLKERSRNEAVRHEMYDMYVRPLMQGRHKSFVPEGEGAVTAVYSFPVVLSSGLKEVKQYTARKEIEIKPAFIGSVIESYEEQLDFCINAKSLLLRCVLFPLYPRLGMSNAAKIAKVLATLP